MSTAPVTSERSRFGRPVVLLIVAALVAMWGYVLYLALFEGRAESPDAIGDPAFTEPAEVRCAEALTLIETLPSAETQRDDPAARADTVEVATDELADMIAQLRSLPVAEPADADLVDQWLSDWETLLDDRRAFVAELRTAGDDARFLITAGPSGRQITLRLDEFAAANDMLSCRSPGDV